MSGSIAGDEQVCPDNIVDLRDPSRRDIQANSLQHLLGHISEDRRHRRTGCHAVRRNAPVANLKRQTARE